MYLLDTDTGIELARGNTVLIAILRKKSRDSIRIGIPSIYEMEYGLLKATKQPREKRRALDSLIDLFSIAEFSHEEAKEAAKIRAELESIGQPIGPIDYQIGGIARRHNWILVTGNLSEFSRVRGLKIETWHK